MSLNLRIVLSATLVLIIFISLIAAALDRAFINSTESALRDKLTSQLYALLAAAEVDETGISMPSSELDALLGLPSSGVYAFITSADQKILWQSSSALGTQPPQPVWLASGKKSFSKTKVGNDHYYSYAYGVNWATDNDNVALTFNISTDLTSFNKQINQYRTTLWGWLLAMAVLLLISQAIILRWGLLPLRRVGAELNRIEAGDQTQIQQRYPQEIEHLTNNINTARHVNKGKSTLENDSMQEQISRMNTIVEYQLQRAATAGSASIGKSVNVKSVCDRMLSSLQKIYRDKPVTLDINIDDTLNFKVDEGDLMELLGNLLDNAFKWSKTQIKVTAEPQGKNLVLQVMDDGPGIATDQIETLLKRGVRADQTTPGHGIGLSIVGNIVDAYQGELSIEKSPAGGAAVRVVLKS
jgi:two-component system sensor histidine kinase PhoQ